jgi:hypothetical protein
MRQEKTGEVRMANKQTEAFFNKVLRNYIIAIVSAAGLSAASALSRFQALDELLFHLWPPNLAYVSTTDLSSMSEAAVRVMVLSNTILSSCLAIWTFASLAGAVHAGAYIRPGKLLLVFLGGASLSYLYGSLGFSASSNIILVTEADPALTAFIKSGAAICFFYWLRFLFIHGSISYFASRDVQ